MKKKKVAIHVVSLGCPKNTADTEAVLGRLYGTCELTDLKNADIVLVNTCAFLKAAREEAYGHIEKFQEKNVVVLGCMSGLLTEKIFATHPQVRAVVSESYYPEIGTIVQNVIQGKKIFAVQDASKKYVEMGGKFMITPPSSAYVKIAEGCDNACAFCLIPALKGHYRSRSFESIIEESKALLKLGVKEINLVSQDCGMYGNDLYGKKRLAELAQTIADLPGDFWLRILYIYPERIDENLLRTIAENPKICRYLDVPLQHGDPNILKSMGRPSNVSETINKIVRIREILPDVALRTSLIVGFPGETKKEFQNLLKFIKEIQFDHVGIFEYSREQGTRAYDFPKQVSAKEKKERREEAMLLQQGISFKKNKSFIGKSEKALVEYCDHNGQICEGRLMRFAPEVDGVVKIHLKKPLAPNSFATVAITQATPYDLVATVIGV